ncbi:MAG: MBL fold metallo-hydrolase [Oscillospiraceae bacterium]|nr:MBL fold metallo-hydrolase [Oscillospiraceae bacterium]
MIEEIGTGIYRIGVPLPDNPLRELNSYFLRGTDRDLLIDTGFRNPVCQSALEEGLRTLESDPARRDVLLTHLHSDHSGNADLFALPGRHVYLSGTDLGYLRQFRSGAILERQRARYLAEGMPSALEKEISAVNPADNQAIEQITDQFVPLRDGDVISVGDLSLETVLVPGHTPGNTVFLCRRQGILFSGDHILFDITPNITAWDGVEDSLGDYLDNLNRIRDLPVKQTLPGHRGPGEFRPRVDELLRHHRRRLNEARRIVEENPGLNAFEITAQMTWQIRARSWDDFPITQKWFAMGECMSHLDYLRRRGLIRREEFGGMRRYYASL